MAYIDLPAKGSTDEFSSTDWTNIKDNFDVGIPAIMTTKGDLAVASASKAASRLAVGNDYEVLQARAGATLGVEWSDKIGVSLTDSTGVTLTNATVTTLEFATEEFDTDAFHNVGTTDTEDVTIPMDGTYLIGGAGIFAANATGLRFLGFQGTGIESFFDTRQASSSPGTTAISFSTIRIMSATNFLNFYAYQNSGGDLGLSAIRFWVVRLR